MRPSSALALERYPPHIQEPRRCRGFLAILHPYSDHSTIRITLRVRGSTITGLSLT